MPKPSFPLVLSTTSIPDSSSQPCFSASAREPAPKFRLLDVWAPNVHLPLRSCSHPHPTKQRADGGGGCFRWGPAVLWLLLAPQYVERSPRAHLPRPHPRGPSPWWGLLVLLEPSSYADNSRWSICHPPLPVLFKAIAFHVDLFTFIQLYISSLPTSSHRIQMGLGTWHEILLFYVTRKFILSDLHPKEMLGDE